jgi:cysteinyl-tRNA synthetase
VLKQVRGIELRYYMVAAHYRSHVEFSFEALQEAASGFRRIEGYLQRVADLVGPPGTAGLLCAEFIEAMNDDLGTPAAVAAIHDVVREGNKLLVDGDSAALRGNAASVHAMLGVLGLDPAHPHWAEDTGGVSERLRQSVDVLVRGLLDQRAAARAAKDFTTADAIRDQIAAAGIEVEDTPSGPRWTIEGV